MMRSSTQQRQTDPAANRIANPQRTCARGTLRQAGPIDIAAAGPQHPIGDDIFRNRMLRTDFGCDNRHIPVASISSSSTPPPHRPNGSYGCGLRDPTCDTPALIPVFKIKRHRRVRAFDRRQGYPPQSRASLYSSISVMLAISSPRP